MIYVNGRFLEQPITGVQRFATELLLELILIRTDITVLVSDLSEIKNKALLKKFNIKEVRGYKGHLWEQITLPIFLKKNCSPLLLSLCSTAPVLYFNQIVTHHDITYIRYPKSFSWKFKLFYKLLIPNILRNSKRVLTVSSFSKQEISEYYNVDPQKISIIYNAVSSQFNLNDVGKEDFALAVSSPNYHKNFQKMIEAFLVSNTKTKLYIIGSLSNTFNNIQYKKDSRIKFLGRLTDEEMILLYQKAKFFIFPSLYEGFGIPPLEAQACGCPVISSNTTAMPEVLGDSVIYFDPNNLTEIVSTIETISSDKELVDELIERGLSNVKRFSWKSSALQLNKIIEGV
ncbi:glycosyltransferase family 4 protein [Acinetobacter boissieri]|uniref:Glycosyltransferase involved in cell wall bisynthesis n=1 Tax=Acinetobacter boissieri TaxID=1219383 RepID=A0A1G6HIU0_9GAMM|nr:glycosyltransferase family 1 protein [Acinetobacter boissieri]SDB94111.1 Glycosyltransferase involved in cell wall bisynthesis [Acinetobacter boissieri]